MRCVAHAEPSVVLLGVCVRECLALPVHVGGSVTDGISEHVEAREPGHVRVIRVRRPQRANGDIASVGPERDAVEIHPDPDSAVGRDQFLLGLQLVRDSLRQSTRTRWLGCLPLDFSCARSCLRGQHMNEGLIYAGVHGFVGLCQLRARLPLLVRREIEPLGLVVDRLPREVEAGSRPKLIEPRTRRGQKHQEVAMQARTGRALRQQASCVIHSRAVG